MSPPRILLPLLFVIISCGGCASAGGESETLALPRNRTGCLPFPGPFTLYAVADPAQLGEHRYEDHYRFGQPDESERGILYTTRAGFLDLAHLRMTIDWTRFCTFKMREFIRQQEAEGYLNGSNGSIFHVRLNYPPDWNTLPPEEQDRFAEELALASGQRLAYLMLVWHETASWFGDRNFMFDESPSAFTYDDGMSHVVGIAVANAALRDHSRPFNEAVTLYLDAQLRRLGAVTPEQTQQAVDTVQGLWWTDGRPLKRQVDIGLDSGRIYPWLVPDLLFVSNTPAQAFAVPQLTKLDNHDVSHFLSIAIEPRIQAAEAMRKFVPSASEQFDVDHDLPRVLQAMQGQMFKQFGRQVTNPRPNAPKTPRFVHAAEPVGRG